MEEKNVKFSNFLGIYCLYDTVAERYGDPVCYANDDVALRVFKALLAVPTSARGDYELYCIGQYQDGQLIGNTVRLVKASKDIPVEELVDAYIDALQYRLKNEREVETDGENEKPLQSDEQ